LKTYSYFFAFLISLLSSSQVFCQISFGGTPPGIKYSIGIFDYPTIKLEAPDVTSLLEADAFDDKNGMPMRFGVSLPVEIDLANDGAWIKLPGGGEMCKLAVHVDNAQALTVYCSTFEIPKGGELYLYNHDQKQIIGSLTNRTNPKQQSFAMEMIQGETLTFEYFQPAGLIVKPRVLVSEIGYAYRSVENFFRLGVKGNADTCEVNINCPEGEGWQDQKNGVARILVKTNSSQVWCTGSLLNNTRLDYSPYFLTANHCGPAATPQNYDQWVFYFQYESPACENPDTTIQPTKSMVGATKVAAIDAFTGSDFKLLLLNESVPSTYHPFFNGWSAQGIPGTTGVTIHHPQGDLKKISTYTSTLISTTWDSVPNTHWRVVWAPTVTNWGVTEGGSSGCPIFDNNYRIVGHLTGGQASCQSQASPDYYGKFSYSWDQDPTSNETMLKPWLDPDDTGVQELDGIFLGVEEMQLPGVLNIYPNPTDGVVFIDLSKFSARNCELVVLDILGKEIIRKNIDMQVEELIMFDLSHFHSGVYIIQVNTNDGVFVGKVMR